MASETEPDGGACARCAALEAELDRLRAKVARLEADKATLLKAAADRDYERPPHYL